MARYIESPGVQMNEIDLSLNASLPVGTNVLINGFTDSGPTQEVLFVTSSDEYKQIYGLPTNAAERYSYHTAMQVLGTNAKLMFNRLPYGSSGGDGFNNVYTAMLYPVYTIVADSTTGAYLSGGSMAYSTTVTGATVNYCVGKPTQITLSEADYSDWKAGALNWSTVSPALGTAGGVSATSPGQAGIIIVNKLKTSVNQDFEGYYVAITDNLKSSTSTGLVDHSFDTLANVYVSKNSVSGNTVPSGWAGLSNQRLAFPLSGDIATQPGSLSEALEGIPTWDFGTDTYRDGLIVGLYKFRRSGFSPIENALTFVPYESFVGALGEDRKYTAPNGFQETTFNLERIVNDNSKYLDVMINPNISKGQWLNDDGTPNKVVRILSKQFLSETSGAPASVDKLLDAAFTLGLYQEKQNTVKAIGDLPKKLELGLGLVEDFESYPLDIVLDAGLTTINAVMELSPSATEYVDTLPVYGIFENDIVSDMPGLLDTDEGSSSLAQISWQTVFNMFDGFCRDTRKDCMYIADCLRHQLVLGKNHKVLSDKTKNFTVDVYAPFRNLVSNANSSYSAIFAQWVQVYDSTSSEFVWVPFSGFQGAIMARLDANKYPWFAPAGLENGIVRNAVDIALNPKQKQRDVLYRHGINSVPFFPNDGIVTLGQKTLQKKPSAFDRINVRRLFLTLEKGTRSIMKYFVFQPNTVFTRTRVNNVLSPIFDVAKSNEGVYDFLIVCDERNNTSQVIDNNELKVAIYLKPVRAAEFILVDFIATRTNQDFNELI